MMEWLITNGHIIPVLIILLLIFVSMAMASSTYPAKPVLATIFGMLSVLTFAAVITVVVRTKIIPESTTTWTQIYKNDVNASVVIDYGENHRVTAGGVLGIYGKADLNTGADKLVTVIVKNGEDESQRKVMINHIEGDVNENSAITKIEYRPTPTMHYQLFGVDGHSQTSYFDGEIRITVSKQTNSANAIFGD